MTQKSPTATILYKKKGGYRGALKALSVPCLTALLLTRLPFPSLLGDNYYPEFCIFLFLVSSWFYHMFSLLNSSWFSFAHLKFL